LSIKSSIDISDTLHKLIDQFFKLRVIQIIYFNDFQLNFIKKFHSYLSSRSHSNSLIPLKFSWIRKNHIFGEINKYLHKNGKGLQRLNKICWRIIECVRCPLQLSRLLRGLVHELFDLHAVKPIDFREWIGLEITID